MKTNKITETKTANGITGYDRACRTSFETLDMGSKGIAVRLQTVRGPVRYMVVTGVSTHSGAYEIARVSAPVVAD